MWLKIFKLSEKIQLTSDVYEIIFETEENLSAKPWQFVTFILDKIGWRAYSILEINWNKVKLIVKKRETKDWWRWWSKFICELEIWDTLKWVWPAWHFLLKESNKNKLFIWTWVGLVPLYNQINWSLEKKQWAKLKLLFWVRTKADIFYEDRFKKIKETNPNFDYSISLSREDISWYHSWYTTDLIDNETVKEFEEYYLCWAPSVVDYAVEKLKSLWVSEENIFYEKY